MPTKLLQVCKGHKSGTTNKLSDHDTAGIIQKLGAAADSLRSESCKTTTNVTAIPTAKTDDLVMKQGV